MADVSNINFNGETLHIKDKYAREQIQHLTADNYTADVTGDYTVNAGDIAMSSANATMHTTADRTIDTDGNDSVHIDGASTLNVGGLRTETFAGDKTETVTGTTTEKFSNVNTSFNILTWAGKLFKSTAPMALFNAIKTTFTNIIYPTIMRSNDSKINAEVDLDSTTVLLHTRANVVGNATEPTAHAPANVLHETHCTGTGTVISSLDMIEGTNHGNVIGHAAFAKKDLSDNENLSIITALWGYPATPKTSVIKPNTDCTVCGLEINMQMNSPDIGYREYPLTGYYGAVGILLNNYRDKNTGRQNWQFGEVMQGTPVDGNYTSDDINNWNAIYTGLYMNHILRYGLRAGKTVADDFELVHMPDRNDGKHVIGLGLGGSVINMGQYYGTGKDNDLWQNDGQIWFKPVGTHARALAQNFAQIKVWNHPITFAQIDDASAVENNSIYVDQNRLYFKDNNGVTHKIAYEA